MASDETSGSSARYACRKAGCTVAEDGLCLEDIDPVTDCKSLVIPEDVTPEDEEAPSTADVLPSTEVQLSHGRHLTLDEAREAVAARRMRVVSIIGDQKAGKTTLLAVLFEKFGIGRFAGCSFAGTRTPIGFDMRCHDSRDTSGRTEPTTPRTQLEEGLQFLHLALLPEATGRRIELLIADRPGEHFEWIRRSDEHLAQLAELAAADVVLVLVDGNRLHDPGTRSAERHKVTVTAGVLHQAEALRSGTRVVVVLTKLDLLRVDSEDRGDTLAAFGALVHLLAQRYGHDWEIVSVQTAARAPDGAMPLGFGLEEVLSNVVVPLRPPPEPAVEYAGADPRTLSAFELFALSR